MTKKFVHVLAVAVILSIAATAACVLMLPKEAPRVYKIGIVSGVDAFASIGEGLIAGMEEFGYKRDENVVYDFRRFQADTAGQELAIKEFIAADYDLIFTFPTGPTAQAKALTAGTGIPVVFGLATLEDTDLINTIREPGGNMTGVRYPGPELITARFEFMKELKPEMKNLLIAYDPTYPANNVALRILRPLAETAGVTLVELQVKDVAELEAGLAARSKLAKVGVDAVLIMPENLTQSPAGFPLIVAFAQKHKLPIGGNVPTQVDAGAVFSYIADNYETGKLSAPTVDKILRGTPPGTIPVITPEAVLKLNYKLATELGLTVSETFLRRADEVIR